MHGFEEATAAPPEDPTDTRPWYRLLNRYHWFVLIVAALGWLFDCLDQQLFILARPQAMKELVTKADTPEQLSKLRNNAADVATSVFIAGWATGGLIFGMLGDRIGRARTMLVTVLIYSACTGLSALSRTVYDFALYRFLTGLGVGGEFAVGVALVAEVMPTRARPYTLSLLQALSAFGNISAALINMGLGLAEGEGLPTSPWRIMFLIGAVPALLALVIRRHLKEPERWQQASHEGAVKQQLGSYAELFGDPRWRRHALLGLVLACSGVIGLWAIGFYTPDLFRSVQNREIPKIVYREQIEAARRAGDTARAAGLEPLEQLAAQKASVPTDLADLEAEMDKRISGRLTVWQSFPSIALNVGAFIGMFGFGMVSQWLGRRPTFAIALVAAGISTVTTFLLLDELWEVFVLVPIMGICQLSLFGGYAIYFPELFPTRLRSTGTSFCYNVGRFVAALGPLAKSWITDTFFSRFEEVERFRYAGVSMCVVFVVGLFALPFLPETKGKPLPE